MKKTIVFSLLVLFSSISFAQNDLLDRIEKQAGKIKELETQITDLENIIKQKDKDIEDIVKQKNKDIESINNKYKKCQKDSTSLKNTVDNNTQKIASLEKENNTIKQLQNEKDEAEKKLKECEDNKEHEIEEIKNECIEKENNSYDQGIKDAYSEIEQNINMDFDQMVQTMSSETINHYISIFKKDANLLDKLNKALIFIEARNLLNKKYDKDSIDEALSKIQNLGIKSELKDDLEEKLKMYGYSNDYLKQTVINIIDKDKKFYANDGDDDTTELKRWLILKEISDFIYNYSFTFDKYPYLSNIISEILDKKFNDINIDISYILEKL